MAKLILRRADGTVRDIMLDADRMTIGRRADNDLCLPFPAVSADHAEIITVAADSFLHDMGSTNGTLVNGKRVSKHFLRDHDQIDIGLQQLVYLTNEAEVVTPTAREEIGDEARNVIERAQAIPVASVNEVPGALHGEPRADDEYPQLAPVDALLNDLMDMESDSSVAVEMPPTVSAVQIPPMRHSASKSVDSGGVPKTGVAVVEVLSGPNAGQTTPMTKQEFVLGKAGVTMAAIRRDADIYRLVVVNKIAPAAVNGRPIAGEVVTLSFGDIIDVAGVKLRFARAS